MIGRYKDHPALLVWGLWDGIALSALEQNVRRPAVLLPQHAGPLRRLAERALHARRAERARAPPLSPLGRRAAAALEPKRRRDAAVQAIPLRKPGRPPPVGHGRRQRRDPVHEKRSHGAWYPRPQDTACAPVADSWGMSMSSNNLLTSEDPYKLSERAFGYDWSRSIGKNGRWWNEESIRACHAAASPGASNPPPEEPTMWVVDVPGLGRRGRHVLAIPPRVLQFRVAGLQPDCPGRETHRPLAIHHRGPVPDGRHGGPPAAQVRHRRRGRRLSVRVPGTLQLQATKTTATWTTCAASIARSGPMHSGRHRFTRVDWSPYRLIYLTNAALMTDELRQRIEQTLDDNPDVQLVADGSFGSTNPMGNRPTDPRRDSPSDSACVWRTSTPSPSRTSRKVETCSKRRLEPFRSALRAAMPSSSPRTAQRLSPRWRARRWPCAAPTVGSPGGGCRSRPASATPATRTWCSARASGFHRSAAGDRGLGRRAGGSRIGLGGDVAFLFNLERSSATVTVRPTRGPNSVRNLLTKTEIPLNDGAFEITIPAWKHAVVHLAKNG